MKSKKVFTFDMDGTILNSKGIILNETLEALKIAKKFNHIAVLCSGRPFFDMIDIAKKANVFDYLICNNGSYFYDMKLKKFFIKKEVNKEVAKFALELGKEHQTFFALHTKKGIYRAKLFDLEPLWNVNEVKTEWHNFKLVDPSLIPNLIENEKITQVSLRATKKIIKMLGWYCEKYSHIADIHIAGEVYLDINPFETSKLIGIQDLSNYIKIPINNFIAFGDSGNDLQMLRGVGLGIAMANATPEAKEAADIIIGDNNSSAISKKIIELLK